MLTKLSENEKNIENIKMELSNILFDNKKKEKNKKDNLTILYPQSSIKIFKIIIINKD